MEASYPHECCGLLVGRIVDENERVVHTFRKCRNLNTERAHDRYEMDPKCWLNTEREFDNSPWAIVGIYHSHPDHPSRASQTDTDAAQTTQTTTTIDGDTKTEEETAMVSCLSGEHDPRTMQSIFDAHKATWESSGLLSMFTVLTALTWPDTLGSYTFDFTHTGFGSHTVDFNDYAGFFTVLRAMFLFFGTFLAYRIIFG